MRTRLLSGPGGRFDLPPRTAHILTLHVAGEVGSRVICDGRTVERRLSAGVIDFLPAGVSAGFEDDRPNSLLSVTVPAELLEAALADQQLDATPLAPVFGLRDAAVAEAAWALHRRGSDRIAACVSAEIARLLAQQARLRAAASASAPGARLSRVIDHIEAHLDEPLLIGEMARLARLSPTTFKLAFRAAFGVSVHRHIVLRRVERARLLLLEDRLPASQIALAVGFANQSHMARWMRRTLGETPSALRSRPPRVRTCATD